MAALAPDEVGFIYLLAFCLSVAVCMTLRTGFLGFVAVWDLGSGIDGRLVLLDITSAKIRRPTIA